MTAHALSVAQRGDALQHVLDIEIAARRIASTVREMHRINERDVATLIRLVKKLDAMTTVQPKEKS